MKVIIFHKGYVKVALAINNSLTFLEYDSLVGLVDWSNGRGSNRLNSDEFVN
jgi:hypothetical protein